MLPKERAETPPGICKCLAGRAVVVAVGDLGLRGSSDDRHVGRMSADDSMNKEGRSMTRYLAVLSYVCCCALLVVHVIVV